MNERVNRFKSQLKTLWDRVCVTSKTLLDKGKTQARKLKPCCQRGKEAMAKVWKWLVYCVKELSANTQDLILKLVAWFLNSAKTLWDWLKPAMTHLWLGICGFVMMIAAKLKGLRKQKTAPLPPAEPELVAEVKPVAELPEAEQTKVLPAIGDLPEVSVVVNTPSQKVNPLRRVWKILCAIGRGIRTIIKWIWRLRGLLMSLPVAVAAIKLAYFNMDRLPEVVGLDIQASGEFARTVSREMAVFGPLGITGFCLLLTISSKKPLFPWVISIFTLVLPPLIWFLNYYA